MPMALLIERKLAFNNITSAESMATSLALLNAIPTVAFAKAGASLIPSPAIATTLPCC